VKRSRQCDRGQDKDALLNYHSDGFGSHTLAEQLEKQKEKSDIRKSNKNMQETQGPKSSTRSFREGVWDPRSGEAGMVARPAAPVPQLQASSNNGTNNLTVIL
jgi:hypothetical protein